MFSYSARTQVKKVLSKAVHSTSYYLQLSVLNCFYWTPFIALMIFSSSPVFYVNIGLVNISDAMRYNGCILVLCCTV